MKKSKAKRELVFLFISLLINLMTGPDETCIFAWALVLSKQTFIHMSHDLTCSQVVFKKAKVQLQTNRGPESVKPGLARTVS